MFAITTLAPVMSKPSLSSMTMRTREANPLWVGLTLGLLIVGGVAYLFSYFIIDGLAEIEILATKHQSRHNNRIQEGGRVRWPDCYLAGSGVNLCPSASVMAANILVAGEEQTLSRGSLASVGDSAQLPDAMSLLVCTTTVLSLAA